MVWLIDAAPSHEDARLDLRAHRLVLRVRVFRRRPLLDGLRIPVDGDVCQFAPDRGDRIAGMRRFSRRSVCRRASLSTRSARILAFAALTAAEWLRRHVLTGFP